MVADCARFGASNSVFLLLKGVIQLGLLLKLKKAQEDRLLQKIENWFISGRFYIQGENIFIKDDARESAQP